MGKAKTERVDAPELFYPSTDGQPMADNSANADRMIDTETALREAFRRRGETAFVARDLFVYPVHGEPWTRNAPDVLVAPGCPHHERASLKYWEEPGTVDLAGEFLSPVQEETFETPSVLERVEFYRRELRTRELFLYQPRGIKKADGFRFRFLRLAPEGAYADVAPGPDGWYTSEVVGLEFRPTSERVDVRDASTKAVYLPDTVRAEEASRRAEEESRRAEEESRRAEEESRRAEEESRRAEEASRRAEEASRRAEEAAHRAEHEAESRRAAEARVRELEREIERLRGGGQASGPSGPARGP